MLTFSWSESLIIGAVLMTLWDCLKKRSDTLASFLEDPPKQTPKPTPEPWRSPHLDPNYKAPPNALYQPSPKSPMPAVPVMTVQEESALIARGLLPPRKLGDPCPAGRPEDGPHIPPPPLSPWYR